MEEKKHKKVFVNGPISSLFIGESIASHQSKKNIGAHSLFLGQVRADDKAEGVVKSIVYEAYEDMALEKFHEIREAAFAQFELNCMHIYHSIGEVTAGEISLFVFTSSKHRRNAIDACNYLVERIKLEVPIWGKEILDEGSEVWKQSNV